MKSILKISITAGLIAFSAYAFAQETDTASYRDENSEGRYDADTYGREENTSFDDSYNTDTTGHTNNDTGDREQQGEDTYNNTENETEYSNERSDSIDSGAQYPVESDRNRYNEQDEARNATSLNDAIVPSDDSVYRQTRQDLRHATDTLDYRSKRNADPDEVGKKVEHVADTVHSNIRDREKEEHGIE